MNHPAAAQAAAGDRALLALVADLTDEQRVAVQHGTGALLVFAGPGAGKTRTLTTRVAYLLASGRARPREILALTFTVRAADEMRVRLVALLGQDATRGVTVATFHGVCARLLREHAGVFGRTARFSVYDEIEVGRIAARLLADRDRTAIRALLPPPGQTPAASAITREIERAKMRLWSAPELARRSTHPQRDLIAALWQGLEDELRRCDAFDFCDLLANAVGLLAEHPAIAERCRRRWRHVLVDEMQDTDQAQLALLGMLAGTGVAADASLTVVGDDDQLLFGFRGARVENLLGFAERFPGASTLVLRRNFRCRPEILAAAVRCIEHNVRRQPKALIADRPPGGSVRLARFANDHQEAHCVAREIAAAIAAGLSPREILVLCRSLYWTRPLQQALTAAGIAHRIIGGQSLWERSEVKDALAYVTLICNPHDAVAFRRAVGAPSDRSAFTRARLRAPSRGVGEATRQHVVEHARGHGIDLIEACVRAREVADIRGLRARAALEALGRELDDVRVQLVGGRSIGASVVGTLLVTGGPVGACKALIAHAEDARVLEDARRALEDLRSLCAAAHAYERAAGAHATLAGFLDLARVDGIEELSGEDDQRLTLATIHGAKGTEAELVYVLACEERRLPAGPALDSADEGALEDERRVFYVAATRARSRLVLTAARVRHDRPTDGVSRFVREAGL